MFIKWIDKHLPYVFIMPCVLFILSMIVFPIGYNLMMSMNKWSMSALQSPEYVGFQNFAELFKLERFWGAVYRTLYFSVFALLFETVLGILFALMLNRPFFAKSLSRTLFLLPVVATPVAIGMVWQLLFEPTIGLANGVLRTIGLPAQKFLGSSSQAMRSLILIDIWEWTPMIMLMTLAGLAAIPEEPYESATVDGASVFQKFRYITLPLASPTILVAMLLRLIDAVKTFDIIYATTKGGPGISTETINIFATLTSFQYFDFGRASAITMLFFAVVILIAVFFIQVKKRLEVDY